MRVVRRSAVMGVLAWCAVCAGAQAPVAAPATDAFKAEPYVVRSYVTRTQVNANGTGTRDYAYAIQLQSEAAVHLFSVVQVGFASASEQAEFVYARVRRPDGTVAETPASAAVEQPQPVTREAPTYSDLKTKDLPLRSLHVGDVLEWKTRVTVNKAEIPGQFYGQDVFLKRVVVLSEVHELQVPAATHITVWTNPHADSKPPTETVVDGAKTYRWEHADLHPTVGAAAEAMRLANEQKMLTAEEELDATKGPLPSIAWTTFADWAAVGAWYRDLIAAQGTADASVRAKVAELTAGKRTDLEKAQAVYAYVSSQIHYVAVSFGVGRFRPHTAAEVLANQYGDCKDKHTLLAAMLGVVGVPADPVLVGVGVRWNEAVPSPASFNHLITLATVAGQAVWLDTTNEVAPWGALLAGVRDQRALDIPPTRTATVLSTPADLPYPATVTVTVTGALNDKLASDSEMAYVFHDDLELGFRMALRSVPASGYGDAAQRVMASFGFGGTVSNAAFEHLDDANQPLRMTFHYHRDKEQSWGDNRVTIAFAPQFLPSFSPEKPPTSSIQLGGPHTLTTRVEETLPPGWTATLPDAEHEDTAFAKSSTSYHMEGNKLVAERRLVVVKAKLPASDIKPYREWYDRASIGDVPYLQLNPPEKVTSTVTLSRATQAQNGPGIRTVQTQELSDADAASVATAMHPRTAAQLVQEARPLVGHGDVAAARVLLDQAKSLDPKVEGLWMGYAAVDARTNQAEAALGDLRLELQYHPSEQKVYNYLAIQQAANGDNQGATATLRDWVHQFPLSRDAALYLVSHLERTGKYQQAYDEAQYALKRLVNSGEDLEPIETAAARLEKQVTDLSSAAH